MSLIITGTPVVQTQVMVFTGLKKFLTICDYFVLQNDVKYRDQSKCNNNDNNQVIVKQYLCTLVTYQQDTNI